MKKNVQCALNLKCWFDDIGIGIELSKTDDGQCILLSSSIFLLMPFINNATSKIVNPLSSLILYIGQRLAIRRPYIILYQIVGRSMPRWQILITKDTARKYLFLTAFLDYTRYRMYYVAQVEMHHDI